MAHRRKRRRPAAGPVFWRLKKKRKGRGDYPGVIHFSFLSF